MFGNAAGTEKCPAVVAPAIRRNRSNETDSNLGGIAKAPAVKNGPRHIN
jgi:hypothetical protein